MGEDAGACPGDARDGVREIAALLRGETGREQALAAARIATAHMPSCHIPGPQAAACGLARFEAALEGEAIEAALGLLQRGSPPP